MNYNVDDMREGYKKLHKEKNEQVTSEQLRELGYSEDDIAKSLANR